MDDFFTSQERVTSDLPRIKREARAEMRKRLEHALTAARIHLTCISHNPLAVARQELVIKQCADRLAQFDLEEWTNL